MAAKGGRIDFMFLGPPYPAAGSATADPTHQPTQPPIHPPMDGGASTDVESSNRTEISRLGQGIFDF